MTTNPTDLAFTGNEAQGQNTNNWVLIPGLTKREYFAAMAMQGYMAGWEENMKFLPDAIAADSVRCADALIAELNKK